MSTDLPTTRRTATQTTQPTTDRDEREGDAPLRPDAGTSWVSSRRRIRQELRLIREQLDRVEHCMDMEMEAQP